MSVRYIGPVAVSLFNPQWGWSSAPRPDGTRPVRIAGLLQLTELHQLSELVNNPHRRATIGGSTGVLEVIWSDDDNLGAALQPLNGWYLLQSFDPNASTDALVAGSETVVPCTLTATYLGDGQVVVPRSARSRSNDFTLNGQALVVNPFWGEDPDGEPFLVDPGGTFFAREYDPTSPHDSARLAATDAARHLGMYAGGVGDLATIVLPDLSDDLDDDGVPRWITARGGDCRAFNRREEREVFGPSHPLVSSTDLVITNGLVQAWVGPRGVPPYLQLKAFADETWNESGYLHLGDPAGDDAVLTSSRLVRVTPDEVSVAVGIQGQGDAIVTLRRGARGLDVQHGSSRTRVTANRRVQWAGLPPWSRLVSVGQGDGKFGNGIDGGRPDATWADPEATWADPGYSWTGQWLGNPDLRLRWPPSASKAAWTKCWWYRPAKAAADLGGAGIVSIFDSAEMLAGRLRLDPADERFKFDLGANTVQSAVQTFAADADVFLCLRFSTDLGMALSVKAGAAALAHVADAAALDPGTDKAYLDFLFGTSDSAWGDGDWGDGTWGGLTSAGGVLDNGMIFDGYLTDAEVATLAAAADRLDGLPSPEAKLVWHLPGDARTQPLRSALTGGRVFEATAEGGATRSADDAGLTKALAVLDELASASGFSVTRYAEQFEVGVYLATTADHDDLADHHEQFAAASKQEVLLREVR